MHNRIPPYIKYNLCNTFKFIGVNLLNNTTSKLNIYYHNLTIQNHLVNVKKYFRKSKVCMERCFIFFTNSSYKNKNDPFLCVALTKQESREHKTLFYQQR